MLELTNIEEKFIKHGGVFKTSDLIDIDLSTRQIERLLADGVLTKVKYGYWSVALVPDIVASTLARLKNQAKEQEIQPQQICQDWIDR